MSVGSRRRRGILLASNNGHKLREYRQLLEPHGVAVISPDDLGLTLEVDETADTFAGNAVLKAEAAAHAAGMAAIADDSGLEVFALEGRPGVHSARYGGPGLSDRDRVNLLLRELEGVPAEKRGARFVTVIALAVPGRDPQLFRGEVSGMIADGPSGTGTFGYDPVFFYPPAGMTFAAMTPEEKGGVSHRGQAAQRLLQAVLGDEEDGILSQSSTEWETDEQGS